MSEKTETQERTVGTEQVSWKRADSLREGNCDITRALCQKACLMTARHLADLPGDDVGGAKTEEQVCYHAENFEFRFVCPVTFSKSRPAWKSTA